MEIPLDGRQTLIVAILVLFLGKYLNQRFAVLREYNISEPVTGGVLASLLLGAAYFLFQTPVSFDLTQRDTLLIVFFTTIGLSSRLRTLVQGGRPLVILLLAAAVYLVLQNLTGVAVAILSGQDPNVGVIGGSVSLSGGHGTSIAWAPVFRDQYGVANASEIGVACATFGLVLGGVLGGPIARFLIARHDLKSTATAELTVGLSHEDSEGSVHIDVNSVLFTLLVIAWSMGLGLALGKGLESLGLQLPSFVTSLFAGILMTNIVPAVLPRLRRRWPTDTPAMALVSDLSLGLFLAMSLMSLQLWTLVDLAGPILLMLGGQVVVIAAFVILVVFRLMGANYDAAVMAAGYAGLGLGATPTAIANMEAVTQKYGASPLAFVVVPLVGAFFIDITNAFVIRFLLGWINAG